MAADDKTPDTPTPANGAGFEPRAEWVFPPEKQRRGRAILVVFLVVLGIAIALAAVLFFLTRQPVTPQPSSSPTATSTATPSPSVSPDVTATASPSPTAPAPPTPSATSSAAPDDALAGFSTQVSPRLTDARTGLGMVDGADKDMATDIIMQLLGDVQRISDIAPPASIADAWSTALSNYSASLRALQSAVDADSGVTTSLADATGNVDRLFALIGG